MDEIRYLIKDGALQNRAAEWSNLPVRDCVIGDNLFAVTLGLLSDLHLGHRIAMVSDARTRDAAGAFLEQHLAQHHILAPVILPGNPKPTQANVDRIYRVAQGCDALL